MREANLFVYCEENFVSSWEGMLKSGWGWTVKNEALEEVVRSFWYRAADCQSKDYPHLPRILQGEN